MTLLECRVCTADTPDALLCRSCSKELEQAIAELPALLSDLERVAYRLAAGPLGLGDPDRSCERGPGDDAPWERPGPSVDGALGNSRWDFSPGPADLVWAASNTLTTWIRHLRESRGVEGPPVAEHWTPRRRRVQIIDNRWHIDHVGGYFTPYPMQPLSPLCTWLVGNIDAIRQDEAAAVIHDEIVSLRHAVIRAAERQPDTDVFAGRCEAVSFTFVLNGDTLAPVADRCGEPLYGAQTAEKVRCRACGAAYSMSDRLAELRGRQLDDQLARAHVIANALTTVDSPISPERLYKWISRDAKHAPRPEGPACEDCKHATCRAIRKPRILQQGTDDEGHPLYRVGDVRDRIEAQAAVTRSPLRIIRRGRMGA